MGIGMKFHDTIPIEPDWYENYKIFPYSTRARVLFEDGDDPYLTTADLRKYYEWADFNDIEMKHSLMRMSNDDKIGSIAFMFKEESYCMAFKLMWK